MSSKHSASKEIPNELALNLSKLPDYIAHIKMGNTLCVNDDVLILQNGSTTLELRKPPKFEANRVPWRYGLIRDIAWCPALRVFILLTQKCLYTLNPRAYVAAPTTTINLETQITVNAYSEIKPYDDKSSFWRCACAGTTVYVTYSGFGTIIDEYNLGPSSCELINRWTPPKTCANDEGIWCIRCQSSRELIGMSIMNAQTNQWRFDLRNPKDLSVVWQIVLPITHGDCEISLVKNDEWLAINSCGIRLIHIANNILKSAVEYQRELKNAITIGNEYFAVRTKSTIEIHKMKKAEN